MVEMPPIPERMASLPRDDRSYPIPYFVAMINGKPEFRLASAQKLYLCVEEKRCWCCGQTLDPKQHAFVIGPTQTITRLNPEPPNHVECAEFAAMACPFLTKPKAQRREADKPPSFTVEGQIDRNPGVCAIWVCRGYSVTRTTGGVVFEMPNPSRVKWFAEARKATRSEIMESFEELFPILRSQAPTEKSLLMLGQAITKALKFVPAA